MEYRRNSSFGNYIEIKRRPRSHHLQRTTSVWYPNTLNVRQNRNWHEKSHQHHHSFHLPDQIYEEEMSRRAYSMRVSRDAGAYPHDFNVVEERPMSIPVPSSIVQQNETTSSNRRNCRMHKSFHERRHEPKPIIDAMKHRSLGDDGTDDNNDLRQLSPTLPTTTATNLENDVFVTHNRNRILDTVQTDEDVEAVPAISATIPLQMPTQLQMTPSSTRKHISLSLEKPHHSFRRIARATQSFYLSPNQFDELRIHRSADGNTLPSPSSGSGVTAKPLHSASMRSKSFRRTFVDTKRTKSFIGDPLNDLSPHRLDSNQFDKFSSSSGDVRRSPRLSSSNIILGEAVQTSYGSRKSSNLELENNDGECDVSMHAHRKNRRKSSIISDSRRLSKRRASTANACDDLGDFDEQENVISPNKRKRIACIIFSLFITLLFVSIFIVVFTLTHPNVSQANDSTRRVYNFAPGPIGGRDSPIHHFNNYNGNWIMLFFGHFQ